jgi:uncharacterized protein with HEPN domain
MMADRDREHLAHMLYHAEASLRFLGTADAQTLARSEEKLFAMSRALQNIGEAATRLSAGARESVVDVPWEKVIGMRHRLVHGYEDIRVEIIFSTIRDSLPPLIVALRRALEEDTR